MKIFYKKISHIKLNNFLNKINLLIVSFDELDFDTVFMSNIEDNIFNLLS